MDTEHIAALVAEKQLKEYSPEATRLAKDAILDYLAVWIAARVDPICDTAVAAFRSPEITGSSISVPRASHNWIDLAAINGFISHLLDFDDMGDSIRGHPSGPVLSALFPLAGLVAVTGHDFLLAYMVGVDGMAIAGRRVATAIQDAGLHPTAILGAIGSALACGRLMHLSATQLRSAISLAIAQTGGTLANFGTPAKPAQVGLAAAAGARAAQLTRQGLYGEPDAIDTLARIYRIETSSQDRVHMDPIAQSDWEAGRILFKRYASCWLTHQGIEAAKELRQTCAYGDDVQAVRVQGSYRISRMLRYSEPKNRFEAKFSLPYCFAAALLYDEPLIGHLTPLQIDEEVWDLARKVRFEIHPDLSNLAAIDREFTYVELILKSGERLAATITDKAAISSREELMHKARVCFRFGDKESHLLDTICEAIDQIESLPDVDVLSSVLLAEM